MSHNRSKWDKYKVTNQESENKISDENANVSKWDKYKVPLDDKEDKIRKIMQETNRSPIETLKDVATGLGKAGQRIGDTAAGLFTDKKIPEIDIAKTFGAEKGNPFVQGMAQYAPGIIAGGPSLLGQMIANAGYGALQAKPETENLFSALPSGRGGAAIEGALMGATPLAIKGITAPFRWIKNARTNLKPQEEAVKQAEQSLSSATEGLESAKQTAMTETGVSPGKIEHARNKKLSEVSELSENPTASNLPIPSSKESALALEEAEKTHEGAQKLVKDIEEQFDRHVNKGSAHSLHIASNANKKMDIIENHYSDSFKALDNELKSTQFKMPEEVTQKFSRENYDYNPKTGAFVKKNKPSKELKAIRDKAPTSKDTDASTFLAKFRDLRDYRFELSQELKNPKVSHSEKLAIRKALKDSKKLQEDAERTLYDGLGPYSDEFKRINKGYTDIVFPLRSHRLAKKIRSGENLPKNFIEAASGQSAYRRTRKAQEAIRQIFMSEPETMRNLIGQRYAGKINKLHDFDELTQQYLDKMPKLKEILSSHKSATQKAKEAEKFLNESKAKHESVLAQEKKARNIATKEQKRTIETNEKMSKLNEEIKKLEENIPKLKQAVQNKKLSLREHIKAKKEYDEALANKEKAKRKLKTLGYVVGGALVSYPTISKINKFLSLGNE